ncbi:MAG TPA: hypothetical protein VEH07_00655 [Alphaproteobacteria bacterium]|nr:hypothetical protein [Alphaproteobacteria bacterium]
MVGLLKFQLSRAILLAGVILLAGAVLLAASAAWATTPDQVFASAASWHPMSAWIAVPAAIIGLIVIICLCAKFIRNDPYAEAQMRGEAGDGPMTPLPGADGHIHFH